MQTVLLLLFIKDIYSFQLPVNNKAQDKNSKQEKKKKDLLGREHYYNE